MRRSRRPRALCFQQKSVTSIMSKPSVSSGIQGKIAAHDRYHFELKLSYTLNPERAKNKYNLELYYFIPKSLGVNRGSYSKRNFFNNIQGYIRFKTPFFSFGALTDPENILSPLTKIKKLL